MNKKYIAPKQLVINLATEALIADSFNSNLGEMPQGEDGDNYNGNNQFSRKSSNLWDEEW